MPDTSEPVALPAGRGGRGDRLAAVLIFTVSALYVRLAFAFHRPLFRSEALGPATFPLMIGGMMLVLSTVLFIQSFRAAPRPPATWAGISGALTLWGLLLGYALLFDRAGFILSTGAFLLGGLVLLGVRPWWKAVLYAVLFTAATWYLFNVLDVRLPVGEWLRRR